MGLQDKISGVLKSFTFAIMGINTALKTERNMRIHVIVSIFVIALSLFFSISKVEWIFVVIAIGGMFALELMNTAVERVVDLVTSEFHPLAKQAKDLAAGAVFIYSIIAVITGLFIFLPYFVDLLK